MSLLPTHGFEIPVLTERVARAASLKGPLALRMCDALGEVFAEKHFTGLLAVRGHPSTSLAQLVMVSVLQNAEVLADRQAADAVPRAGGLETPGFDVSVLSEFGTRLTGRRPADRLLTPMLHHLREGRLLDRSGQQRADAAHVHAGIRMLNRLELSLETMRAALEALGMPMATELRNRG